MSFASSRASHCVMWVNGRAAAQENMPVNQKKREYAERLTSLIKENNSVILVEADNVGSKQMQGIRIALRGVATILMGKNVRLCPYNPRSLLP